MKKRATVIAVCLVCVLAVAAAIATGLSFRPKPQQDFNESIHLLVNGTQMTNDEFVGFALHSARQGSDGAAARMRIAGSAAETQPNTLFAIDENFDAEEVRFKSFSGETLREITQKEINEYGAITQIAVTSDILFIEITAREDVTSNEIKEDSYFTLSSSSAVFAVDLRSGTVSSVRDACTSAGLYEAEDQMYFDIRYGLFFTNPGIVSRQQKTYLMQLQNGIFRLKKVADTPNGNYVLDKYNNIYLIDDGIIDLNAYNWNLVNLFTRDDKIYDYFFSSDKRIFRALKSDYDFRTDKYSTVESLQADRRWAEETSSSDQILRNQLEYSENFQGGEWMLKEGKIIRIASNVKGTLACYNVDGKLIAHLKNDREEVILDLGDENQVSADFPCIDFYPNGYAGYEKIISFETDSPVFRYSISIKGTTHVLTVINDNIILRRYKIAAEGGKIKLTEIKPMYNGAELSEEVLFTS